VRCHSEAQVEERGPGVNAPALLLRKKESFWVNGALRRKGASSKEIAGFLGHRDPKSIGIYAKYDTRLAARLMYRSSQNVITVS
jgi:hypothetical protein